MRCQPRSDLSCHHFVIALARVGLNPLRFARSSPCRRPDCLVAHAPSGRNPQFSGAVPTRSGHSGWPVWRRHGSSRWRRSSRRRSPMSICCVLRRPASTTDLARESARCVAMSRFAWPIPGSVASPPLEARPGTRPRNAASGRPPSSTSKQPIEPPGLHGRAHAAIAAEPSVLSARSCLLGPAGIRGPSSPLQRPVPVPAARRNARCTRPWRPDVVPAPDPAGDTVQG